MWIEGKWNEREKGGIDKKREDLHDPMHPLIKQCINKICKSLKLDKTFIIYKYVYNIICI